MERGDSAAPHHMVIESENYHALQLLLHAYEGQVDCIYIDPPYNTGAKDWKYNNNYVDDNDTYRHSKWLSMIDKRLRLAKRLLKPDGILIVTIDKWEVHHLALILEDIFRDALHQLVPTVTFKEGKKKIRECSDVAEYMLVCLLGESNLVPSKDNYLVAGDEDNCAMCSSRPKVKGQSVWRDLLRGGKSGLPSYRPNLVYQIMLDNRTGKILKTGWTLKDLIDNNLVMLSYDDKNALDNWLPDSDYGLVDDEHSIVVWPINTQGNLRGWRIGAETLMEYVEKGYVRAQPLKNGEWKLEYLMEGTVSLLNQSRSDLKVIGHDEHTGAVIVSGHKTQQPRAVWFRDRHSSNNFGANLLEKLIENAEFPNPKSVYLTRDALMAATKDDPDALVIDFFAGSGTTLHATLLLNEADGGRRRCILVTNNEIGPENEKRLGKQGIGPNSQKWQRLGIFESVTRPRVEAAISGERADGTKLDGKYTYADDKPMADGFEASADFFRLRHLNPDEVISERSFDELHPLLWAASGGFGSCPTVGAGSTERHEPGYLMPGDGVIPADCHHAVLLRESRFSRFTYELRDHPQVTHVWLQARNEASLAEMRADLPGSLNVSWLYQDWWRYFDRVQGPGHR